MKFERSDVEFPLWRKKVDSSLFTHNGTTIPAWACSMWNVPTLFSKVLSKKNPESQITITFHHKNYPGWITESRKGLKTPQYRLWFDDELSIQLKHAFLMSHMRALEKN